MGTIYKLNFSSGDFYIGQTSRSICTRVTQHKSTKGRGCPLLAHAFEHSIFTGYEVLEDNVPSLKLDAKERYWIETLKPSLNTLPGGKSTAGLNHPRLKYTKEQIEEVLNLYLNSEITYAQISDLTEVGYGMVQDICKRRAHSWVWEGKEHCTPIRDTTKVFTVYNKDNQEFTAESLNELSILTRVPNTVLKNVFNGCSNRDGWTLLPHPQVIITNPLGETLTMNIFQAKKYAMLSDPGLSQYQLDRLFKKFKRSADWEVSPLS